MADNPTTERLSTIASFAVLICLLSQLLMWLPRARSHASSDECKNRLKNLALGMHFYHDAFRGFPAASGGTTGDDSQHCNEGRLSGFAAILPFIEQQAAWEQLTSPDRDSSDVPMGPSPSVAPEQYSLWGMQFDAFLCPLESAFKDDYGLRSYLMNYGDAVDWVGKHLPGSNSGAVPMASDRQRQACSCRGAFITGRPLRRSDFKDGEGNTVMLSESVIDVQRVSVLGSVAREVPYLIDRPAAVRDLISTSDTTYRKDTLVWSVGKGARWAEGHFVVNGFTTVLPPNSPSATVIGEPDSGVLSATSHHPGGVHVVMVDGGTKFIGEMIDTGNLNAPSVCIANNNCRNQSPYGVWGAMGTRASRDAAP